jgi:hypothetical protein
VTENTKPNETESRSTKPGDAKKKEKKEKKDVVRIYDKELLSCNYFMDGEQVRVQLGKWEVYHRGSWLVLVYLYQDKNHDSGNWSGPRVLFARYRNTKAYGWTKKSSMTLDMSVGHAVGELLVDLASNLDKYRLDDLPS